MQPITDETRMCLVSYGVVFCGAINGRHEVTFFYKESSKNKPKDLKNQPSPLSKYRYSFHDTRVSKKIKKLNLLVHWGYNTFL